MESLPRFMAWHLLAIACRSLVACRRLRHFRCHLVADAGTLQPVDDDMILRLEALANHAQPFIERPEHNRPCLHRVVFLDHEHDLARLVDGDSGVRDQQRLVGRGADDPDPAELPGQDREILVRDDRTAAQRRGRDVQSIVEEVHLPLMRGFCLAGQRHLHRVRRVARARPLAFEPQPAVALIGRLVDVEIDVDRIERYDRGQ